MCEYHSWEQKDSLTRVCNECGSIDTDVNPMKTWISPRQSVHLGFVRNVKYALLELKFIPKIEELPA